MSVWNALQPPVTLLSAQAFRDTCQQGLLKTVLTPGRGNLRGFPTLTSRRASLQQHQINVRARCRYEDATSASCTTVQLKGPRPNKMVEAEGVEPSSLKSSCAAATRLAFFANAQPVRRLV